MDKTKTPKTKSLKKVSPEERERLLKLLEEVRQKAREQSRIRKEAYEKYH